MPWPEEELWNRGIPRPWMLELFQAGYRRECVGGQPGTIIIFDNNIVHRGSFPAIRHHRDYITFDFIE